MAMLRFGFAIVLLLLAANSFAEPEVFSDAGFEADKTYAAENDRLHVVYFTASWCGPCQRMKKTTWVDESLVGWLDEYAVVSSVDVDEEPKIAQEFGIRSMPTMVAVRGGEELGRAVGYKDAGALQSWLEDPTSAESARPGFVDPSKDVVRQKMDKARDLMYAAEYVEATEVYVDLWEAMLDDEPSYYGVRLSFFVADLERLIEAHEPARAEFRAIRDREADTLESGDVTWDGLTDWVHLNRVIGDEQATIEWVERISEREGSTPTLTRYSDEIYKQAESLGRWDVVAEMVKNPVLHAKGVVQSMDASRARLLAMGLDVEADPYDDVHSIEYFLKPAFVSVLYAEDGGQKERELTAYLDVATADSEAWRFVFVQVAQKCGKLRDDHRQWMTEYKLEERYGDLW